MKVAAVISMLHEPADRPGSATRLFRGQPVLAWTLKRLARAQHVSQAAILCWDDQIEGLLGFVGAEQLMSHGPRQSVPRINAIAAARRWADGWRGGLLSTCCHDQGFDGERTLEVLRKREMDAALLVDPEAGLVDPALVDAVVTQARRHPEDGYAFGPAAPGLSGLLLTREMLEELLRNRMHPGQLLAYLPDIPGRDPISRPACAPVPTPVARTLHHFLLNSDRQIARIERATADLNGQLLKTDAEGLVQRMGSAEPEMPREVVLELTTRRATAPIFLPVGIERADLSLETAKALFAELDEGVRVTLAGLGDGLLHGELPEIVRAAGAAGIAAVHLETDLLGDVEALAGLPLDVISVHIPATTPRTYAQVMGRDALPQVLENLKRLVELRQAEGRGVPLVVPTFVKCHGNLHEMESWYDHWLRILGCAVIAGPSDYAGRIADVAAADMAPPRRVACRRLARRMTVLCDGTVVSCEQDVAAQQALGRVGEAPVREIWERSMGALRSCHGRGDWNRHPVCARCREWHRP